MLITIMESARRKMLPAGDLVVGGRNPGEIWAARRR